MSVGLQVDCQEIEYQLSVHDVLCEARLPELVQLIDELMELFLRLEQTVSVARLATHELCADLFQFGLDLRLDSVQLDVEPVVG